MSEPSIAVLDYGVGNIWSIWTGLRRAGARVIVTSSLDEALEADGVALPGVGAFKAAMQRVSSPGRLVEAVEGGLPLLGVCIGFQMLFDSSEEGGFTRGLGILKGEVKMLPRTVKLPHIGWNTVSLAREDPLLTGIPDGAYFYFVHSYAPFGLSPQVVSATTEHGARFASVASSGNVFGTQFHPEKSGTLGLMLLKNFVDYVAQRRGRQPR